MKKLLLLALCAILAAGSADARTLYVNAKRPNNNGNGLKPATAKKTIQAAINIARAGDTILVSPGTYAPIRTDNKKITIKSVKGVSKTRIVPGKTSKTYYVTLARLGRRTPSSARDYGHGIYTPFCTGRSTKVAGILFDGLNRGEEDVFDVFGISGGTLQSCTIQRIGNAWKAHGDMFGDEVDAGAIIAFGSRLTDCKVANNWYHALYGGMLEKCSLNRCIVAGNKTDAYGGALVKTTKAVNCLFAKNTVGNWFMEEWLGGKGNGAALVSSTFVNCTFVANTWLYWVYGEEIGVTRAALSCSFANCILYNNKRRKVANASNGGLSVKTTLMNIAPGNTYANTYKDNRNPKFASGYKLAQESPCINRGKLTAAQKKLVGAKDLAGRKRVRGKAIDMGCYEY
jgi:hypothetical protein